MRMVLVFEIDSGGVAASVAVTTTLEPDGFGVVGIPVIWPVLVLMDKPGGKFAAVHL